MFKVYLANGQVLTEKQCRWDDLPDYSIIKLEYLLPNKKTLLMEGFSSYCHIKEYYNIIYGAKGVKLDTINLLGKYGDKTYQFSLHVRKGKAMQAKHKDCDFKPMKICPVANKKKEFTIEFSEGVIIAENFWHPGVSAKNPTVKIN